MRQSFEFLFLCVNLVKHCFVVGEDDVCKVCLCKINSTLVKDFIIYDFCHLLVGFVINFNAYVFVLYVSYVKDVLR